MNKRTILSYAGLGLLGALLMAGSLLLWNANWTLDAREDEAQEAARPADIEITLVAPVACEACLDGAILVREIEKQDVRVLSSASVAEGSEEAAALIQRYGVSRLPAVVVKGEYDKQNVRAFFESLGAQEREDALVIEMKQPVYKDLASGAAVGLVDVTYLTDSACADCYDPRNHSAILKNSFGVAIRSETDVDAQSAQGRALIAQYAIEQTPTVVLSSQALAYDRLAATWKQVGSIEEDGAFVFRQSGALGSVVYRDLATGTIVRPVPNEP